MTLPRITIITPNLHHGAYLERAICSVLDQGYENLEYMVVDAGKDEKARRTIRRYAAHLSWWRSASDNGPADAINRALTRMTGQIVGILPSNGLYLPGTLQAVADRMASGNSPRWITGHCARVNEQHQELGQVTASSPRSIVDFLMHNSGQLPTAATFYHQQIFEAHGRFDERLRDAYSYEMSCRLLVAGLMPTILPQTLAVEHEQTDSVGWERTLQRGLEYVEAAQRFADHLPIKQRYALWRNCDERRRIYALAQAEAHANEAGRFLWQQLLRRPWWLASERYRRVLLGGAGHPAAVPPLEHEPSRHAA